MSIKYELKPFDNLSNEKLKELSNLSFKKNYGIKREVNTYQSYRKRRDKYYCSTWTSVVAEDEKIPVAWAIVRKAKRLCYIMIYVKPSHRRQGIGSILFTKAKESIASVSNTTIFPHDYKSERFFKKHTKPQDRKVSLLDWNIAI